MAKGDSLVQDHKDAVLERDAIKRAILDEGESSKRLRALEQAEAKVRATYGRLNGTQVGLIKRWQQERLAHDTAAMRTKAANSNEALANAIVQGVTQVQHTRNIAKG